MYQASLVNVWLSGKLDGDNQLSGDDYSMTSL